MSWWKGRRAWLRNLLARRAADARMDEEIAYHIERATEQNLRAGMSPAEARRQALLAFGGVEQYREAMRDGRRLVWLEDLLADARFALRWLRRSPGFAVAAILTIGLGVGATTALFSVVNAFLLRPLPVVQPDRLYTIQEQRTGHVVSGVEGMQVPRARYEAYVEATEHLFTGLAAHSMTVVALRVSNAAQPTGAVLVSGNYFDILGVRPAIGRLTVASDEPAVVLSHRLWRGWFGGDPEVLGRTVWVDGRPLTVAGVAQPGFTGTNIGLAADLWIPYLALTSAAPGPVVGDDVSATGPGASTSPASAVSAGAPAPDDPEPWLAMFGRLRPGVDPRQAEAMLPAIARRVEADVRAAKVEGATLQQMTGLPPRARPLLAGFLGLLLGMATLVLLIAATNVGAMQLARAVGRRREVAVRLAIGAGRGRLIRQLLTESLVLYLFGGTVGVLLAWWATHLIGRIRIPVSQPILLQVAPDLRVFAFGLAISALAGIAAGLAPALRSSRPDLNSSLKDGAPGSGSRSGRGRGVFVAAQLALAVVLLAVAGLFTRTLQNALRLDPGFDPEDVVVVTFDLSGRGYDAERGRAFQAELIERIRAMPDVEAAALGQVLLLTGSSSATRVARAEDPDAPEQVLINGVDEEYFRTLRIPLLAGEGFQRAGGEASRVVVVNETLARRFWPDQNPLGKRLRRGDTEYEVIGVARDGLYLSYDEPAQAFAFFPLQYSPRTTLHVRTRSDPAAIIERIRHELMLMDPDVAIEDASPLTAALRFVLLPQRAAAFLIGFFGLIGLILAGIGIYGALSYHVAERTREIGIRMALGAGAGSVARLVIGRAAWLAAAGVAAGTLLAVALGRLIEGVVFGAGAHDPVTLLGGPLLLGGVAVLASFFPVRRALRADPVQALRQE